MPRNINNISQVNGYSAIKPKIDLEWSSQFQSQTHQSTGYCGKIIPIFWRELMPNQTVELKQDIGVQFTPFVSNVMHEFTGELINYFVPYRLCAYLREQETIDDITESEPDQLKWEEFITGGGNGQDNQKFTDADLNLNTVYSRANDLLDYHSLPDYLGLPIQKGNGNMTNDTRNIRIAFAPVRAYNLIYNEALRNPDFTPYKYNFENANWPGSVKMKEFFQCATAYWNADRFTRARKWQLRGITPSIPISNGLIEMWVKWQTETTTNGAGAQVGTLLDPPFVSGPADTEHGEWTGLKLGLTGEGAYQGRNIPLIKAKATLEENSINSQMSLNDLLYNIAIMKYESNNARIKPRYVDQLKYRFGIIPQDARFQDPEYVSGEYFDIGVENITQTSGEVGGTNQGHITGQAWGGGQNKKTTYKAMEHGILMTLMVIKPKGVYELGISKFWRADRNRFDFPTPELMNLPDTKIKKTELGINWTEDGLFGWQQIYDEYRSMENYVTGLLRPSVNGGLGSYTLARYFETAPELNDDFLLCKPDMNRIKQYPNQPDFIFFSRTEMKTAMPMPMINEPINLGI